MCTQEKYDEMQNIIKEQEMIITELNFTKNNILEELEDYKTQVGFKTDQLNEWKQKYEVNQFMYYLL